MNTFSHFAVKVLITTFLCVLSGVVSLAATNKNRKTIDDRSSYIQIEGTIFVENKEVKGNYLIEVIYFDSIISTHKVKGNKPVVFHLKKNTGYTLKISKEGFIARYINITTDVDDERKELSPYSFYLDAEFITVKEAMRMDDEALQLPIAMIGFDKRRGNFRSNNDYSIFVRQRLYTGQMDLSAASVKN